MTELLIKLIDQFVKLAERQEKQRADHFRNFIEPAWRDFETLHQDYLASIRRYSEMLSREDIPFDHAHPMFAAIELDSMISDSLREKMRAAWSVVSQLPQGTSPDLSFFLLGCLRYVDHGLNLAAKTPYPPYRMVNGVRLELSGSLRRVASRTFLSSTDHRNFANSALKGSLERLQQDYSRALWGYELLRSEFLRQ